ncbi:hypothetical protein ACFWVM_01535 [Nocardia fluminea]|uniref:hypothetical protein n=1 Tax=Nocardia fluminea TaxID=134984 RepID=UPI00365C243E
MAAMLGGVTPSLTGQRYPQPDWIRELWWVRTGSRPEVSRTELARLWFGAAAAPKPRKKEFIDELKGWSGMLGGTREWVRERYGALAAFLAGTDSGIDEPAGWLAVSRLYGDYADPLARFSAQFALLAHEHRPRGIPNKVSDRVKSYELVVPPSVRAAMAGERLDAGIGGVIDTAADADAFIGRPYDYRDRYVSIAMRRYASHLLEKRPDFLADQRVLEAIDAAVAALAVHGDPDRPAREPTPAELRHVDGLLTARIDADPTVRDDPRFAHAYLRARKTMLRWTVEGRELTDATVLYTKLRSVGLDDARADYRTARREVSVADPTVLDSATEPTGFSRLLDTDILSRAAAELDTVAPPSWERALAAELLRDGAGRVPFDDLRAKVRAGWNAVGSDGPPTARARNPVVAARLVDAILFMAVASVIDTDDVAELLDATVARGIGARFDGAATVLQALDEEEDGTW